MYHNQLEQSYLELAADALYYEITWEEWEKKSPYKLKLKVVKETFEQPIDDDYGHEVLTSESVGLEMSLIDRDEVKYQNTFWLNGENPNLLNYPDGFEYREEDFKVSLPKIRRVINMIKE